jgi:hypothetical protein
MSSGIELSAVAFGQHVHPALILMIFFIWGGLKDKVYKSNSQTEEELKENICRDISSEQLEILNWNFFHQCEKCLHVERQHFQHLLLSVTCSYFVPTVIGHQTCGFSDKICICLASGNVPVALKHSTMNPSIEVRTFL